MMIMMMIIIIIIIMFKHTNIQGDKKVSVLR
jgi:hypothetical protein